LGSAFGCARAGLVVYEFVTTGIEYDPGACAYCAPAAACAAERARAGSTPTAGGGVLCVTFGTLSAGNSRDGAVSVRRGEIVSPLAARVAATGTT
jgi:hypothetical protein